MSSIEEDIRNVLLTSTGQEKNKERNAKCALTYYGFSNEILPSLIDVARICSIGTGPGVFQVLKRHFRSNPRISEIAGIQAAKDLIAEKKVSFWSEIRAELCKLGFISEDHLAAHLKLLLKDLGMLVDFELYTPIGSKVTRSNAETLEQYLFVHKDVEKDFLNDIKKLRKLPSRCGMARSEESELVLFQREVLPLLIDGLTDSWMWQHENQTWFLFEDEDQNRLFKQIRKAFCTGTYCEITRLARGLENGLRDGGAKTDPEFPPVEVIQMYLRSSKLTRFQNDLVSLRGEKGELEGIEKACVQYFRLNDRQPASAKQLTDHLSQQGFSPGYINRVIWHKSILNVDKSSGSGAYLYSLVCNEDEDSEVNHDERYQEFVNRLMNVAALGTDVDCESTRRQEQDVLRKWIFAESQLERCAICGKELEVEALVAAHKKKRKECTEAERLDPYIVMPVCLFGCDYLYENKFVTVQNGKIAIGPAEALSVGSSEVVRQLSGREVDKRWTTGSIDYFH